MDGYAKLLTSVAMLLGAVAWPGAFILIVLIFRRELKSALTRIPAIIDRVRKASVAGVVLELERVADAETRSGNDKSGKVSALEIEASNRIEIEARDVDARMLLREMDKLCLEYDSLRRTMPAGEDRTRAMTRVLVKMRALAPSLVDFLDVYKGSGSPGSRLAAIAMMQMVPRSADVEWLIDRFSFDHPFLFYHAALALQNVANFSKDRDRLREGTQRALRTIKSFSGVPDQNTIEVLESLLSDLSLH